MNEQVNRGVVFLALYEPRGSSLVPDPDPSLAEVIAWRKGMNELVSRCMFSWTAEGFNRIHHMGEAEKRYKAMGLL